MYEKKSNGSPTELSATTESLTGESASRESASRWTAKEEEAAENKSTNVAFAAATAASARSNAALRLLRERASKLVDSSI